MSACYLFRCQVHRYLIPSPNIGAPVTIWTVSVPTFTSGHTISLSASGAFSIFLNLAHNNLFPDSIQGLRSFHLWSCSYCHCIAVFWSAGKVRTYAFIHDIVVFIIPNQPFLICKSRLYFIRTALQETNIVFIHSKAHIIYLIFQKSDSLQADITECKAGVFLGSMPLISSTRDKIYRSPGFQSSLILTETAALPPHLKQLTSTSVLLSEREMMGRNFTLFLPLESSLCRTQPVSPSDRRSNVFIVNKALYLMEGRGMGGIHFIGTWNTRPQAQAYG